MIQIASTRFNNKTLGENNLYKNNNNIDGVIYGVNVKINEKYPFNTILFIIEMNNDLNKINGIGLIKNKLCIEKKVNIYSDFNYNQYIYQGDYWISREKLLRYDNNLLDLLEAMLFKGKSHLKRQSGISIITNKLFKRWNCEENILKENLKVIFLREFKLKPEL